MNKKKNNKKIISVLIVLACFVLFAGVLLTGLRNYKTEKKEKTIESEETKAQDEANRNQRIREILEEFMA